MKLVYTCSLAVIVLFLSLAVPFHQSYAAAINWRSYEDGIAAGIKEGKKVVINFYADWCPACRMMDQKTFTDPLVIDYLNKNFICIKVNGDNKRNVAMQYRVRAYPTTSFVSEDGEQLGNMMGAIPATDLLVILKYFNTDSYKTMPISTFKAGLK